MKLLLDTSVIIDFLRRKDKGNTLLYKLSKEKLYISIVTHTELFCGKSVWENKQAKKEIEDLFSGITILPLGTEISEKAGKIKALSHNISILDCIIGATALSNNLELVTLNTKDFDVIDGLELYSSSPN